MEKDSLLNQYGLDELSDTDGENEIENPMSPEQIAMMSKQRTTTAHCEYNYYIHLVCTHAHPRTRVCVCACARQSTGRSL